MMSFINNSPIHQIANIASSASKELT